MNAGSKQSEYMQHFATEATAMLCMRMKNRACRLAGNHRDVFVVTDGPQNDFVVVDLATAIELGAGYKWEV